MSVLLKKVLKTTTFSLVLYLPYFSLQASCAQLHIAMAKALSQEHHPEAMLAAQPCTAKYMPVESSEKAAEDTLTLGDAAATASVSATKESIEFKTDALSTSQLARMDALEHKRNGNKDTALLTLTNAFKFTCWQLDEVNNTCELLYALGADTEALTLIKMAQALYDKLDSYIFEIKATLLLLQTHHPHEKALIHFFASKLTEKVSP